jgi:GTPase SAR1 family protein
MSDGYEPSFMIKVAIMGDGAVGKTALRESFLGRSFDFNRYIHTIGADFAIKDMLINNRLIRLQIWD